jgi:hypothetical protein
MFRGLRWTGWRSELGWTLIGLAVLAPCTLMAPAVFLPTQDPTPAMLAEQAERELFFERRLAMSAVVALVLVALGVRLIMLGRRTGSDRLRARRDSDP